MSKGKPTHRTKLGLSLAGGGFRASLFHLGVLRRMAELDLLRYVEVLSTVSGGSIIGGLYILLLKKYIELAPGGDLDAGEYVQLVKELEETLVGGIQKNLRTRLFMNPAGILRVLLTERSLGKRMAHLYERYIYKQVVSELKPGSGREPGRIPLEEIIMKPGGKSVKGGIETYNQEAVKRQGSVITNIVINATSMNSGGRFRFSAMEIGDWYLGYFRHDEIGELLKRKHLLHECGMEELGKALENSRAGEVHIGRGKCGRSTISLAAWWRDRAHRKRRKDTDNAREDNAKRERDAAGDDADKAPHPAGWEDLFNMEDFPGRLPEADFGLLRRAKLAAWYIRVGHGLETPVDGGMEEHEHMARVWAALRRIDRNLADEPFKTAVEKNRKLRDQLLDFVQELYWLRNAEAVSSKIRSNWDKLTLGDAVGASACFPPVFPPYVMLGIYDDLHVSRLGLTDGGVFDNIGITSLLDEGCNYIIASDTSGLFVRKSRASTGRAGMIGRIVSILTNVVAGFQREALRERRRVSREIDGVKKLADFHSTRELKGLAFFGIDSPPLKGPGLNLNLDREALASLRTDLDAFGDVEVAALVNQGYDTADRHIREFLEDYSDKNEHWKVAANAPILMKSKPDRVNRIIRAGHSRLFRGLSLGAPVSWVFTIVAVATLVALTWSRRLSVDQVTEWLSTILSSWIGSWVPWLGSDWTSRTAPVGVVILGAIVLVLIFKVFKFSPVDWLTHRHLGGARRLASAVKWIRSWSGSLLWFFGWLPLAIALAAAILASVSYLFFHLPFMRKTRR